MTKFNIFLIYAMFCLTITLCSCSEDEGTQDAPIVELNGTWKISGEPESEVTFDKEDETFSLSCERGEIIIGMYSYTSEHEILFQWENEEFEEEEVSSTVKFETNGKTEYAIFEQFPFEYKNIRLIKIKH